jgi:hypothetical protein
MESFALSLPEVASLVVLHLDFESLLQIRCVSHFYREFLNECSSMLSECYGLPKNVKNFFHWAILFSCKEETRYSSLFIDNGSECTAGSKSGAALTVEENVELERPSILIITQPDRFYGDQDAQRKATLDLILSGNLRLAAKVWNPEIHTHSFLDDFLFRASRENTCPILDIYLVDTYYPDIKKAAECCLECFTPGNIPESWFIEKSSCMNFFSRITCFLLEHSRTDLISKLDSFDSRVTSIFFHNNHCQNIDTLLWVAGLASKANSYIFQMLPLENVVERAITLRCTKEQLLEVINRCMIKQVKLSSVMMLYDKKIISELTQDYLEVILPLTTTHPDSHDNAKIDIGMALLFQYSNCEEFRTISLLENVNITPSLLEWLLEKHKDEINWDKISQFYINNFYTDRYLLLLLTLLCADVKANGFSEKRWKVSR